MPRTKLRQAQRRRAHLPGIAWRDPLAAETDAMVGRWRISREALPPGERHLIALFDSAVEVYAARLHPGESIFREPGSSRFRTWQARLGDLWERALEFLDTFGFAEDVCTAWVALHHAYTFDDRVPHDTEHCGLCLLRGDSARAVSPDAVTPERLRFGPLPRDLVPFCVAERIELLSTYSSPPDRPAWEFAPVARSIARGDLDRNELTFEAGVTEALEHVGLVSVLRENKVRFSIDPVGEQPGEEPSSASSDSVPGKAAGTPVGEAGRVREALRAQLRGEVHRWLVRTGREPREEEWSRLSDWPSGDLISAAYGSFEELIEDCELDRTELARRTRQLEREHERARGLSDDAKERLAAVAARERALAGAEAEREELERAAGEARELRAQLERLRQRLETAEAERSCVQERLAEIERARDMEPAARGATGAAPGASAAVAPRSGGVEPGLPLYRLWLTFDAGVAAEQLLATVAKAIAPAAGEPLCAARSSGGELEQEDGSEVLVDRLADGDDWVWHARWRRVCQHEPEGRFEMHAVVCASGPERHVGLEVSLVRPGVPLAPMSSLGFRAPELPALLLDAHPVEDGGWPLRGHALELRDRGDAEELADFLHSTQRRRPVVHCSARRRGPSVDAHRLARELAGLAHVTYSNDGRVDDLLKAHLPGRLGAWGGAVRVYYPGLGRDVEHRYFSAEEIGRHGEGPIRGRLLRDLGQLACATMVEPEAVREVSRRAGDHEPKAQLAELLDEHERTLGELEHARTENDRLHRQLEKDQRLSEQQARQIGELSHRLARDGEPTPADGESADPDRRPRTVVEAVKLAIGEAKHLVYAPSALESAEDSPYHRPEQILDALRRLDQLAEGYLDPSGIGCGLDERARQLGLRWQGGLQDTIVGQYPNHYTISYQGRRWKLGPHVGLGGGDGGERLARIYLVAHPGDRELERALIVGHVGRHLPDNTTG